MSYPSNSNCTFFYTQFAGYLITPVSGATGLPPGLSLGLGSITGAPTTLGITDGTINDGSGSQPWRSIVCTAAHEPTITNAPLVEFYIYENVPSSVALTGAPAFDGTFPLRWSKHSDVIPVACAAARPENLPPGLTLNSNGTVTGTPTTPGNYTCHIALLDGGYNLNAGVVDMAIHVLAGPPPGTPLAFACGSPPAGTVDVPYSHTFPASGGTPPYTFAIVSGVFPPVLSFDAATGSAMGIPVVPGTFAVHLSVTDSLGAVVAIDCSITIAAAPPDVPLVLPGTNASPIPLPDPTKGPCK